MIQGVFHLEGKTPDCCPICGAAQIQFFGTKDFNESCNDFFQAGRTFPDSGKIVRYWQCAECHFVFTNAFDQWSLDDFGKHIYNEDYIKNDMPFLLERPQRNARMIAGLWHRSRDTMSVLDYGGGNGVFAGELTQLGFKASSCDIFYGSVPPPGKFRLVTCFEVIEHVPAKDQERWFAGMVALLHGDGTILLSSELVDEMTIAHWYISPRNGHISIHSRRSLDMLAAAFKLQVFSINNEMHLLRAS